MIFLKITVLFFRTPIIINSIIVAVICLVEYSNLVIIAFGVKDLKYCNEPKSKSKYPLKHDLKHDLKYPLEYTLKYDLEYPLKYDLKYDLKYIIKRNTQRYLPNNLRKTHVFKQHYQVIPMVSKNF